MFHPGKMWIIFWALAKSNSIAYFFGCRYKKMGLVLRLVTLVSTCVLKKIQSKFISNKRNSK